MTSTPGCVGFAICVGAREAGPVDSRNAPAKGEGGFPNIATGVPLVAIVHGGDEGETDKGKGSFF